MTEAVTYSGSTSHMPWRTMGLAALVGGALFGGAMLTGAHRSLVPPSFGVARNGLVAWALGGDIWTGDPVAGTSRAVVATDDIDRNPVFSRDGTHLAFLRQVPSETGYFDLVVTRPDASAPVTLTPIPVAMPDAVEWAPDGMLLVNEPDGRLTRYALDGKPPVRVLDGVHLEPDAFRPPNGTQLLYERDEEAGALYVMNADGSAASQVFGPRTAPCACPLRGPASWSPDGERLVFGVQFDAVQTRLYVMDAAGGGLRPLTHEAGGWVESDASWSPDGTRVAFNRWQVTDTGELIARSIAVVDIRTGTMTAVVVAPADEGALIEWAPDSTQILSLPRTLVDAFTRGSGAEGAVARHVLITVANGSSRQLEWSVGSVGSWQRLAG